MMAKTFDDEAVRALADILVQAGLTEIEVERNDVRIRLVKAPATVAQMGAQMGYAAAPVLAPGLAPATTTTTTTVTVIEPDDADHPGVVTSPMVGIVYLAPEPGSPNYVANGQPVIAGQTVCMIEAMKTYNQIKAAHGGTVLRVLVANGEPVEYGQPLLIVA